MSQPGWWTGRTGDVLGIAAILGLTTAAYRDLMRGGFSVTADLPIFFYPMSSFLGERLRRLEIPGWNPHQFAGAPFAADPQSGWMYVPSMALYSLLPLAPAAKGHLALHLALAGLGTYGLGRAVGLSSAGALVAAVAYEFSGSQYPLAIANYSVTQVAAWWPTLLLCAEQAMRADSQLAQVSWWGAAGLALSQVLASWLGQGAYYVLLAFAGYVAWRRPSDPRLQRPPARIAWQAHHGGAMLLFGFGLAAAGVLPRLDYIFRSNLGTGYSGDEAWASDLGGWDLRRPDRTFLAQLGPYVGGATAALAVMAPVLMRGRLATTYGVLLTAVSFVLGANERTPLHRLLYTIVPRFKDIHRHFPDRVTVVLHLGPALLAGATVSALPLHRERTPLVALLASFPAMAVLLGKRRGVTLPRGTERAALGASLLLGLHALVPQAGVRRAVPVLLAALTFGDLVVAARRVHWTLAEHRQSAALDFADYERADGAAEFLRAKQQDGWPRYFGFNPALTTWVDLWQTSFMYLMHFAEQRAIDLLVNNRATLFRLNDVQGYNPVQSRRYVEYMAALNGEEQGYHQANVLPGGIGSPLLNLLGARYIVVPAPPPKAGSGEDGGDERPRRERGRGKVAPHPAVRSLRQALPTVFRAGRVWVLENRDALPRAWIVHEARQVAPGEALGLLSSGQVDPRRTALLEAQPPALDQPANAGDDQATVITSEPDRIRLRVRSGAAGLLMLAETYDPGWRGYVDGALVPVLVANHVFRAVPIPAGEHLVELRYESRALRAGLAVSVAFAIGLAGAGLAAGRRRWRLLTGRISPSEPGANER